MNIYVVQAGDTVQSIGGAFGLSPEEIIYLNQLAYPYGLALGQALLLPTPGINSGSIFQRHFFSFGYAYPFIDEQVLQETLPYLSALAVFSYGFSAEGELVPPQLPDEPLVEAALAVNVRPILTLTPFGPDGNFNNYLVSAVLNDLAARQRLFRELLAVVQLKGYLGVDVDFEYVLPEDRQAFSAFVQELADLLHSQGLTVSVALAPKTYAEQPGLLYEGQDYAALGAAADYVLLMTYEWGYTYSEPMPIAPLNWVRRVLAYAVQEIPPAKINLGIPNYAYDWTLPYVKGESRARTLGVVEAMQQAVEVGAEIFFDETAQTPYYNYWQNGQEHQVWFEDVRSLAARFQLVNEFGLRGGGWWQLMRLFRAGWRLLAGSFYIDKIL